jgi:hypothetical protein
LVKTVMGVAAPPPTVTVPAVAGIQFDGTPRGVHATEVVVSPVNAITTVAGPKAAPPLIEPSPLSAVYVKLIVAACVVNAAQKTKSAASALDMFIQAP